MALAPVPLLGFISLLPTQAVAQATSSGSLTVTTIARNGHRVASGIVAVNLSGFGQYNGRSGHAFSVPDGHYVVMAGIQDAQTGTLDARLVTVNGHAAATLDGRKGRLVSPTLNAGRIDDFTDARVCAGVAQVELFGTKGSIYAVPTAARAVSFGYVAEGRGAIVSGLSTGVPAHPGGSFHRSGLARLTLTVRGGEQAGYSTTSELAASRADGGVDCRTELGGNSMPNQTAPYVDKVLVSPGYWTLRADDFAAVGNQGDDIGGFFRKVHLAAGHGYSEMFYRAAWGPTAYLPLIWRHSIEFTPASTITDPAGDGSDAQTMNTITLSLGSKLLSKKRVTGWRNSSADFTTFIKKAGWYTLGIDARRFYPGVRFPAGLLSPRITLNWRFYARTSGTWTAPAFLTKFLPVHLGLRNQALPNAITRVNVLVGRPANPNAPLLHDTVRSVRMWESANGGKTWRAVSVRHTGGEWVAMIHDPATGFVALRSQVTGSRGDTSTETIYRAYAV